MTKITLKKTALTLMTLTLMAATHANMAVAAHLPEANVGDGTVPEEVGGGAGDGLNVFDEDDFDSSEAQSGTANMPGSDEAQGNRSGH